MRTLYYQLMHGAIRRNQGNGLLFYEALAVAPKEVLLRAKTRLESQTKFEWQGHHLKIRLNAINRRLAKIETEKADEQSN